MITKDAGETIEKTLQSIQGLPDAIIVADDYSKDNTREIAEEYGATVFLIHESHEGRHKQFALGQATSEWVLNLDADEVLTPELKEEIIQTLSQQYIPHDGYVIPFLNHFLGRPLRHGGENYSQFRLFRREVAFAQQHAIHAPFEVTTGKVGTLRNYLLHFSYRSIWQLYVKFTKYAWREAHKKKTNGEGTSLKKLIMYPAHMFWARFFKDKGYKDGLIRIPLDFAFAYMEFLTYFLMVFIRKAK